MVARDPVGVDAVVANAVRAALHGPMDDRRPVVEALVAMSRTLPPEEAVEDVESMLRHADPAVRGALLAALVAGAADRVQVRDALVQPVVEHLRDPEPALRLLAARAVAALGPGGASGVAAQLAFDTDRDVRHGALAILGETGDARSLAEATRQVELVDALLDVASVVTPDDRVRWAGALEQVVALPSPRVSEFLSALLRQIPAGPIDPFLTFAVQEVDRRVAERTECGVELVEICRHLMAPPQPRPDHAARLAAACAAGSPLAFDFLWTLFTAAPGEASAAARDALAGLIEVPKSHAVESAIDDFLSRTESATERSLLRMLKRS
jgi:hypothetical protein